MIVRGKDIDAKKVENPRGGRGSLLNMGYEAMSQFSGDIKMFSVVNLKPDSSIGYHIHEDDMEIYFILDGSGVVSDNGQEDILYAGDLLITKKGEGHSIENKSGTDITFLAMIIK
jgi:mannose-6-phosphate isomerase-like protein (cupin superfamily)